MVNMKSFRPFLLEMNTCCGFDLHLLTKAIASLYLAGSVGFLWWLTTYFTRAVTDDAETKITSILFFIGLVILDVCVMIPSALGVYGARQARGRSAYLIPFLIIHGIFIGFIFVALIACIVKTSWMLISVWIQAKSVGEDITAMIFCTLLVALTLPFVYVLTSMIYNCYNQLR